jgi:predicted HAD superfamily phosphohydrolase YqeG
VQHCSACQTRSWRQWSKGGLVLCLAETLLLAIAYVLSPGEHVGFRRSTLRSVRVRRYRIRHVEDISTVPIGSVDLLVVDVDNTVLPYQGYGTRNCEVLLAKLESLLSRAMAADVILVSNATFELDSCLTRGKVQIRTLSNARKPWTPVSSLLEGNPRPRCGVAVMGDLALTDGLLAFRLGATFIQVEPVGGEPGWPRILRLIGVLMSWLLFEEAPVAEAR